MLNKLTSASAVIFLTQLAAAQTFSSCNPVKGQNCPADPAFGGSVTVDFTKGASEYFSLAGGTNLNYDPSKGAEFVISKESDAPTITSTKYLFFGTVEVVCQAAPGTGIVTSFVLQSDDLDEIDWEWLGGDTIEVQTNYFSKGDTSTYNRGGFSAVSTPQTTFHTYKIDWSPQAVVWSIDGATVRTLTYDSASGGATFPQTPMQIKLGTWDGGASTEPQGTQQWAGGLTPFGNGNGPYTAYYKSITITDNSNGVKGASSYSYQGTSGTYSSIKVNTGGETGNSTSTTTTSSSKTSSSTKTTSASTKTSSTATTLATTTSASSNKTTTSTSTTTSSSSSKATTTAATVSTNGVGKVAANLFGAAGAMLVAYALM